MRFSFLSLLAMAQACQGKSNIYVVNNTEENITFDCTASNDLKVDKFWWCYKQTIRPGRRVMVASMNRDKGIKNGKTYLMKQKLSINGRSVVDLEQSLSGSFIGSSMAHSISGAYWYRDSNDWHDGGPYGDNNDIWAKWESYSTGGDDDLDYVIRKDQFPVLPSTSSDPDKINVASYNVYFMTNGPLTFNCKRAQYIPAHVKDYDVIMFTEVWTTIIGSGCRNKLLSRLRTHPYVTPTVSKSGFKDPMDGGAVIASKYPLTKIEQHVFTGPGLCAGDDCLSSKGVIYASINKDGKIYHFFGTHLQAYSFNKSVREKQLHQMKKFISDQNIAWHEPVIMGGDFNVPRSTSEYANMLTILNAKEPYVKRGGARIFTNDPDANKLASDTREDLDYVLVSKSHMSYNAGFSKTHFVKHWDAYKPIPSDKDKWDLSDHFPVAAHLDFSRFGHVVPWNVGDDDETLDDPRVFVDEEDDDDDNAEDSGETHTQQAKHLKTCEKDEEE